MRKHLYYSASLTFLITVSGLQKLVAQNTSPYWSLAGNSNASSTISKLGTTNAINLRLFANNIERLHINYSNGYVGIGTTAPTYKLHVSNTANAIYGYTTGTTSVGVWGQSPYRGVYGNGSTGVYGNGTSYGLYGHGGTYGVYGVGKTYGVYGTAPANSGAVYGVYGICASSAGSGVYGIDTAFSGTGVSGVGLNSGVYGYSGVGYGVYGFAPNGIGVYGNSSGYGVFGQGFDAVYGHGNSANGQAVYGFAEGGGDDWGGRFESTTAYGVYASTNNTSSYAGFFAGVVYASGGFTSSDRKLKKNISDMTNAMDIINKLQPKYYEYRQDGNYKLMNLPTGTHFGLIAQDVEQVLPNLVKETEFNTGKALQKPGANNPALNAEQKEIINFKALNYTELIPIIVKAMQELDKKNEDLMKKTDEIDDLKKKNNELEDRLSKLEAVVLNKTNRSVDLSNVSLEQNTPNPFNSSTIIRYHLPQNAGNGKLVITDMNGKVIKNISLTSGDNGQLTLNSGVLTAGSYNYTLWLDGKQVDSKKMVIAK